MKTQLFVCKWIVASILILSIFPSRGASPDRVSNAQKSFERTRLELKQQGFKTDLAEFNFSIPPEARAREFSLTSAIPRSRFNEHPELLEPIGINDAIVVWKQDSLRRQTPFGPDWNRKFTWQDFEDAIAENEPQIDDAVQAVLAGPIQFDLDASRGAHMLLRHLPGLKNLTQFLNDRVMLALHQGNREAAWTNLLAATRLVTAWNPEPVDVSHRVRFNNAKLVFKATWQTLQTNGWTDSQLARLQQEWEAGDFLSRLPEIQAFRRASELKMLESDSVEAGAREGANYEDAERLLRFYKDREMEYRNAIAAKSWTRSRAIPGVTNEIYFEPKYRYQQGFAMRLNMRRISTSFEAFGGNPMPVALEAETQRGIVITAIALERFYGKYQRYPETLEKLVPEFLNSVPADFITSEPLRYRVSENKRFLLYSVGLDCVDNRGKIESPLTTQERARRLTNPKAPLPEYDIVWPLEASSAQIVALRRRQSQDEAEQRAKMAAKALEDEQRENAEAEKARADAMKKLLARKPSLGKEPIHQGIPLSVWVTKAGEYDFEPVSEETIEAIRAIGPKAIPFLLEWMPHRGAEEHVEGYPDPSGIEVAWWALGTQAEAAIPELTRRLNQSQRGRKDDYSVLTITAKAISYLGPKAITPMLTVATNMQGKHELWEVLHNFQNFGTNGAAAVPALLRWANDPDDMVRNGVVSALGGIGERADLALPVLLNALRNDTSSIVRRDAAEALGAFANKSNAVLPELTATLNDPEWQARGGALSGLGKIKDKPEVVVPLISRFLYDTNNVLQRTAAYALRDLECEIAYRALFQASNAPSSWPGIGDIIYQAQQKARREESQKQR